MGLALAWRYVNMGDQPDPTGKMPVGPQSRWLCSGARTAVAPYHSSRFVLRHRVQNAMTKEEQRKDALTPQQIVC